MRKEKPTWRDVKQHLTDFDRAALLSLVQNLYQANKDNQTFLHARFQLAGDNLQPYKKTIERWVCPDAMRNQPISTSKAKKAIGDYKKAAGSPEGMAELSMFYCESCMNFLDTCGMDDESYFDALVRMMEQAINSLKQLPIEQQAAFIERLDKIRHRSSRYGYGVEEGIEMLMEKYSLTDQ
jgi:hypothetical protein